MNVRPLRSMLWMLFVVLIAATLSVAQTSRDDASTADAIDAIDALHSVSASPIDEHSHGSQVHRGDDDWPGLIRFFAPGLIVAASLGVAGSVVGTFVLLRREALVALTLPQVVAVGAAAGMRMGWPVLPAAVVAVAAAVGYFAIGDRRGDAASRGRAIDVPSLYVAGLCVSFLLIAHAGGHVEELQNLFTGIDVAVTPRDAAVVAPILLAAGAICAACWRRWLLLAQAPASAELAGVRLWRWDALFLGLLAVVVLVGTSAQGAVLVLAMLFLPPAIVAPWAGRVPTMLMASAAVSLITLAAAFVCSVKNDWPLSHSVGGVAFVLLIGSRSARALLTAGRGDRFAAAAGHTAIPDEPRLKSSR